LRFRTDLGRHERRGLEGSRDIFGGLEDEKGFSTFAKFHWQVLLDIVDPELDLNLLSTRPKELQAGSPTFFWDGRSNWNLPKRT